MSRNQKPPIHSQAQLSPFYRHYRDLLCANDAELDQRLSSGRAQFTTDFLSITKAFSALFFDAFGVLNRGSAVIPGAVESVQQLKAKGKPCLIVSNNASSSPARLFEKYQKYGFSFQPSEIISSGMPVSPYVEQSDFKEKPYYLIGTPDSASSYAYRPAQKMVNHDGNQLSWSDAEYILMCSNRDYYGGLQQQEIEKLLQKKSALPILLANPDLVAPKSDGSPSAVAGYTAAELRERFSTPAIGLGKPFPAIFEMAKAALPPEARQHILMIGDTLDTDILGAKAMGFSTCLTLSGIYQDSLKNAQEIMKARQIYPDFVVPSIAPESH
ncbi:TIGR01459 family HAD-type hydrolase [Magnetococcales bacterium HHB-1]